MGSHFFKNQSLVFCLAVVSVTTIISIVFFLLYRLYYPKLSKSHRMWDDILLKAIYLPLQVALWLYALTYGLEVIHYFKKDFHLLDSVGLHLRDFIFIIFIFWFVWQYISYFEERVTDNTHGNITLHHKDKLLSLSRFIRVLIIGLGVIIFLQFNGIPISGLLAFGGMGALILGLAAKDILANFFGGLLIYADRPFTIGDWINSPDKDIEGIVERIGWRLTTVRRFDKRVLYIPNSIFSTITLENGSKMTHRRILFVIGLRYSDLDSVNAICEAITKILAKNPQLDLESSYFAKLIGFSSSSIDIKIQTFTKQVDYNVFMSLQHRILLQIASAVKQAGAEFAFPTQTLDIPKLS